MGVRAQMVPLAAYGLTSPANSIATPSCLERSEQECPCGTMVIRKIWAGELSDPGDETPEAMGCANDCCHPDHGHFYFFGSSLVEDLKRPYTYEDHIAGCAEYGDEPISPAEFAALLANPIQGKVGQFLGLQFIAEPDTHDEWRELNDG